MPSGLSLPQAKQWFLEVPDCAGTKWPCEGLCLDIRGKRDSSIPKILAYVPRRADACNGVPTRPLLGGWGRTAQRRSVLRLYQVNSSEPPIPLRLFLVRSRDNAESAVIQIHAGVHQAAANAWDGWDHQEIVSGLQCRFCTAEDRQS